VPVAPRTWSPGDPVSPTYLNTDLYAFDYASPLSPNGVQFHGRKPLYRAAAGSVYGILSDTWGYPYEGQSAASVIQDSAADYGSPLDSPMWGSVECVIPGAGGSVSGTGGGWFLLSAFSPVGSAGSNGVQFGASLNVSGSIQSTGQYGAAQSGKPATPWTCDLVSLPSGTVVTPAVYNSDSATRTTVSNSAGTGTASYFQGHWATAGGTTIPAWPPAPKTSWSAGDQWTAAWANGPAGIAAVLEFLNSPPCLRANASGSATSVPSATATVIGVDAVQLDAWGAFNAGSYEWTCPADGLYFCYGRITWSATQGSYQASVRVNGTDYWGPCNFCHGVTLSTASKVQVFSLLAGDTIQLAGYQTSGSTLSTSTGDPPRLVIAWVSAPGVPGVINPNPYLSGGSVTGWAGFGGSVSIAGTLPAGWPYPDAMLFTPNDTESSASAEENVSPFAVTAGDWYGVSSWVQAAGTTQVLLGFDWLNSSHGFISSSHEAVTVTAGSVAWQHTIQQAAGSAAYAYARVGRINGSATIPATETMFIAGVQAGQAGTLQPVPPDLSGRYSAGTPGGSVPAIFSAFLGNDLTFLCQRPYLLAYATSTQGSISSGTAAAVQMQAVAGQVHGDRGDNYGGWVAADFWYAAQAAGWYLAVFEGFVEVNASASFPGVEAQLQVSTGSGPDNYESHVVNSTSDGTIPGAAAIGYYYLRPGDAIWPLVTISNYPAAGTTSVAAHGTSHFECVWVSE
jgi:hypothetical protein